MKRRQGVLKVLHAKWLTYARASQVTPEQSLAFGLLPNDQDYTDMEVALANPDMQYVSPTKHNHRTYRCMHLPTSADSCARCCMHVLLPVHDYWSLACMCMLCMCGWYRCWFACSSDYESELENELGENGEVTTVKKLYTVRFNTCTRARAPTWRRYHVGALWSHMLWIRRVRLH